jgi:hypothetical protein
MLGIADPAELATRVAEPAEPAEPAPVLEVFEADSECPGATDDTRAANPAVNAAAPAITQRRVRLTRASAASRIIAARDRSIPEDLFSIVERENHRSVRPI